MLSAGEHEQNDSEMDLDVNELDVDDAIAGRLAGDDVRLPPFPPVLVDVSAAVARGAQAAELARLISGDARFAWALLGAALQDHPENGAGSGFAALERAIDQLGDKRVMKIGMSTSLAAAALDPGPLFDERKRVWRHSVGSALVAEALAESHGVAGDVAYLAGLFHDYGRIVALACVEDAMVDAPDLLGSRAYWTYVVDRHHCDLGQAVAERWALPQPIPAVVAAHHERLSGGRIALLDVVHAADAVMDALGDGRELDVERLAEIEGVPSREEAVLVALALDRLAATLAVLGSSPPRTTTPAPATNLPRTTSSTFAAVAVPVERRAEQQQALAAVPLTLANALRVCVPTRQIGSAKVTALTTVAVAKGGVAFASAVPLHAGFVTHVELDGPRGAHRVWVTVTSTRPHGALYISEATPLKSATLQWTSFVEQLRAA